MSVQNNIAGSESVVLERPAAGGVYASLFEKINLSPVSELSALDLWQDAQAMSDATADERLTAGMQVFLECLTKAGAKVEKLDKSLIDHHIAELDYQISRQLDAVMHHDDFQAVESLWRGVKSLVDKTDFRQNVKIELLSMSKEDLRQDFEDSPEIIQSGLYKHTYIDEYDTPGGEPIAALISAYEFDASAQDVALLRNISKVSAAAHMPFTEGLAEQLSALTPDLTSQGLQQTCGEVKHNFLLTLADQLIREPESVTAPLSVMLNPYHPLPLAGVVFSQPSAGAERAVTHHWGMDKRWDILPESVRMLPAGLRPRKPGVPWRNVFASVAALAMVGWAGWMSIAYVTNCSQINGANVQASTAARQNQPLEQRLHALSELQKTLARLQYRSEHGVPWYEKTGLNQNNALLVALWPRYRPRLSQTRSSSLPAWINCLLTGIFPTAFSC